MTPKQFSDLVQLADSNEVKKATLVSFYLLRIKEKPENTLADICKVMQEFGLGSPNQSRLSKNITASRAFIKTGNNQIKLSLKKLGELEDKYPQLSIKSEEIIADDTVLPEALYLNTRGYLSSVWV